MIKYQTVILQSVTIKHTCMLPETSRMRQMTRCRLWITLNVGGGGADCRGVKVWRASLSTESWKITVRVGLLSHFWFCMFRASALCFPVWQNVVTYRKNYCVRPSFHEHQDTITDLYFSMWSLIGLYRSSSMIPATHKCSNGPLKVLYFPPVYPLTLQSLIFSWPFHRLFLFALCL